MTRYMVHRNIRTSMTATSAAPVSFLSYKRFVSPGARRCRIPQAKIPHIAVKSTLRLTNSRIGYIPACGQNIFRSKSSASGRFSALKKTQPITTISITYT